MRSKMVYLWLLLVLGGCATADGGRLSARPPINPGAPVVYIHPLTMENFRESRVGVPIFLAPANIKEEQGRRIAALFKDVLLGKELFKVVKLLPVAYGDYEEAVALGRKAGVELVVAGKVNYALEGSELGGARVEVELRLLDVATGNTVWHIVQTMDQEMDYPRSDFASRLANSFSPPVIRSSSGGPVLVNMLVKIAGDMSETMAGATYVQR